MAAPEHRVPLSHAARKPHQQDLPQTQGKQNARKNAAHVRGRHFLGEPASVNPAQDHSRHESAARKPAHLSGAGIIDKREQAGWRHQRNETRARRGVLVESK